MTTSMEAGAATKSHASGRRTDSPGSTLPRVLLALPAGLALLAGLDAALMLIDAPAPVRVDRRPDVHGMLMVLGFVGSLIALERAVALRRPLGFGAPVLLGLGSVLLRADGRASPSERKEKCRV